MTKAELRRALRALPALTAEEIAGRSARLCAQLIRLPAWTSARVVALYAGHAHEPRLDDLWVARGERIFCFPRVLGEGVAQERLAFFRVDDPAELEISRWALLEPAADPAREISPAAIDLVVIPGMAFTIGGARIGRGRGHYDRFLAHLSPRATTVGVCFAERLLSAIPTESHDIRLQMVVSA
jgi:5-formyltetrahydrofolate cyclo-ligase